jgi:hypothetical protein
MTDEEKSALESTFGCSVTEHQEPGLPGVPLIQLSEIMLPAGCSPDRVLVVFARGQMNGYLSRLFFEKPIIPGNGLTLQLQTQALLGRVMYVHSINQIPATLPPHQAILAHLRMYERK